MSTNVEVVLEILKNEIDGDVASALQKMAPDYTMTWMYKGKHELFPSSRADFESEMTDIYTIKGRSYEIKNVAEGESVVMVELIERYPNAETGALHQTPLVLVLEMSDGKIHTGRHYCDPQLSYEQLSEESINGAYKNTTTKLIIS